MISQAGTLKRKAVSYFAWIAVTEKIGDNTEEYPLTFSIIWIISSVKNTAQGYTCLFRVLFV